MVELYWLYVGLPLSQGTGYLVDLIDFPISEVILWFNLWSVFHLLLLGIRCKNLFAKSLILKFWFLIFKNAKFMFLGVLGVLGLLIQVNSQGLTPYDSVPTKHRLKPLDAFMNQADTSARLLELGFQDTLHFIGTYNEQQELWLEAWTPDIQEYYNQFIPENELELLNYSIQKALKSLGYPPGRTVRNIKSARGITKTLGLAYGGPAYHDVITGEVVLSSIEDYPTFKIWRIMAIIHEIIHAQGFTDEMVTEQLTWLTLHLSNDPMLKALSHYMFLLKSPNFLQLHHPKEILLELIHKYIERKRVQREQTLTYWMSELFTFAKIQNSGQKYGQTRDFSSILEGHPWFNFISLYL